MAAEEAAPEGAENLITWDWIPAERFIEALNRLGARAEFTPHGILIVGDAMSWPEDNRVTAEQVMAFCIDLGIGPDEFMWALNAAAQERAAASGEQAAAAPPSDSN